MRRIAEIAAGIGLAWLAGKAAAEVLPAPPAPSAPPAPAAAPPSPPRADATLGPAFDVDASMATHAAAVAGYTLRATLDPTAHSLHGEGQITWRNASSVPQRELWVHLYPNAFKNERTLFNRLTLGAFRGARPGSEWGYIEVKRFAIREMDGADVWPSGRPTSPGDPDDETDIRVPLPREVPPLGTITIDVTWDEHLPALSFRSGHFGAFHMIGQWFPKLARLEPDGRWAHFAFHRLSEFSADFGSYDVTVDTPDNVVVGATGHLEGEIKSGGRVSRRFVQEDVHDFGFTAWDDFQERAVTSDDGVAIRCLYPRGEDALATIEIAAARAGLAHFGRLYGRYPYRTLTIVHPPEGAEEAGGMEYPTLITTGGGWYMPTIGVRYPEIVTLHELGHQWFYGLVATDEHAWPFLDEGITSYAEADVAEALFPNAGGYEGFGLQVALDAVNRSGGIDAAPNGPIARAAPAFQSGPDYGSLVYQRTATILRTFARVHGDDLVRRAIGRYARRYRFEHPGPEQLLTAFGEVLGDDAARTLRAALFDRGSVDYAVSSISSETDGAAEGLFGDPLHPDAAPAGGEGFRGSVTLRRRGALRFPVDVDLTGEDGAVQRIRWEAREVIETIPYRGASKLASVVIDPEHRVLLDENLANNARRVAPSRTSLHVLERALFHAQAGLGAVLP